MAATAGSARPGGAGCARHRRGTCAGRGPDRASVPAASARRPPRAAPRLPRAPTRSCPARPGGRRRCVPWARISSRWRRSNGTNPSELVEHLRSDRTLWLDECGALFFQDEVPADLEPRRRPPRQPSARLAWPTVAPAEAFALHSRPGSQRVLFLDFDGHRDLGTAWNSLVRAGHLDGAGRSRPTLIPRRSPIRSGRSSSTSGAASPRTTPRSTSMSRPRIRGRTPSPARVPRMPSSARGC